MDWTQATGISSVVVDVEGLAPWGAAAVALQSNRPEHGGPGYRVQILKGPLRVPRIKAAAWQKIANYWHAMSATRVPGARSAPPNAINNRFQLCKMKESPGSGDPRLSIPTPRRIPFGNCHRRRLGFEVNLRCIGKSGMELDCIASVAFQPLIPQRSKRKMVIDGRLRDACVDKSVSVSTGSHCESCCNAFAATTLGRRIALSGLVG